MQCSCGSETVDRKVIRDKKTAVEIFKMCKLWPDIVALEDESP